MAYHSSECAWWWWWWCIFHGLKIGGTQTRHHRECTPVMGKAQTHTRKSWTRMLTQMPESGAQTTDTRVHENIGHTHAHKNSGLTHAHRLILDTETQLTICTVHRYTRSKRTRLTDSHKPWTHMRKPWALEYSPLTHTNHGDTHSKITNTATQIITGKHTNKRTY